MKFLLTSGGVTNKSIADALTAMLPKPVTECTLAFIPTAANVEDGDKSWVLEDMSNLREVGFALFDIVDVSALTKQQWLPRLEAAEVIAVGGGCTPYLLDSLAGTGAAEYLSGLGPDRVYVGISAGSIAAGIRPIEAISTDLYSESTAPCLGLADLTFLPHLNSPSFPKSTEQNIRDKCSGLSGIYAMDDQGAAKVVDGVVEVITEGKYLKL